MIQVTAVPQSGMETKHRKGDFLLLTDVLRLQLISGAKNKERRLVSQVDDLRHEGIIANLGIIDLLVTRIVSPKEVHEPNHEVKSAPALYVAKARHAKEILSEALPNENAVRFAADTHPKIGNPGKSLHVVVTKYPTPLALNTYDERIDGLSNYIESLFGHFSRKDPVLMRAGLGVVPWFNYIIGIVDVKSYVEYGRNPLPDKNAAKDFLQMCAETHVGCDGKLNNTQLERNLVIAGATPQEDLIRFAVENRIPVEVRGRSSDPLGEIDNIGDGFTHEVVQTMLEMIVGVDYTSKKIASTKTYYGGRRVSLLPNSRHKIIWSGQENMLAAEYVGQYSLS